MQRKNLFKILKLKYGKHIFKKIDRKDKFWIRNN